MCLDHVHMPTKYVGITEGYKVCRKDKQRLYGEIFTQRPGYYKKHKWYHNTYPEPLFCRFESSTYKAGFHVYRSLSSARHESYKGTVIVKVKIKNITASGLQYEHAVVVCQDILFEKEVT